MDTILKRILHVPVDGQLYNAVVWLVMVIASVLCPNPRLRNWLMIVIGSLFGIVAYYVFDSPSDVDHMLSGAMCALLFYPIFILNMMYGVDTYMLRKMLPQILLITVTGFALMVTVAGFMLSYTEQAGLPSAAVVLMSGVSFGIYDNPSVDDEYLSTKSLQEVMNGEVIFTAALGMITHEVIHGIEGGYVYEWYHFVMVSARYTLLGILVGVASGKLTCVFKHFLDDTVGGVIVYISYTYLIFALSEGLICCSGVIACATLIFYIPKDRPNITEEVSAEIKHYIRSFHDITHAFLSVAITIFLTFYFLTTFHVEDIIISVSIYVIVRAGRAFQLFIILPLLGRITPNKVNKSNYLGMVSGTRNGVGSLISAMVLIRSNFLVRTRVTSIVCIFCLLSYTINGSLVKRLLRIYKLLHLPATARINISSAISLLCDKQMKIIGVLKMNRFFSDSNWPLINECTKLANPFYVHMDNDQPYGIREITCYKCFKKFYVEPTKKEYGDMAKEAMFAVTKSIKVALMRQYDYGSLNEIELYDLLKFVEKAAQNADAFIKLDEIYKLFKVPKLINRLKLMLYKMQAKTILMRPKARLKAVCFDVVNNFYYKVVTVILVKAQIGLIIAKLLAGHHAYWWSNWVFLACDCYWLLEFAARMYGRGTSTGSRQLIRNYWNIIDFASLVISLLATGELLLCKIWPPNFIMPGYGYWILNSLRLLRVTRAVQVYDLFQNVYPKLLANCDRRVENINAHGFTLAVAIIIAYEDTVEQLEGLIESQQIRDNIKKRLESDKVKLIEYTGAVVKRHPGIPIKVQTKQAVLSILKQVRNGIQDLKTNGYIDLHEFDTLTLTLDRHLKSINVTKYDEFVPPRQVFSEIVYLSGDTDTMNFLYENATTKIWNAGDVICNPGEHLEGVYIIIAGMFKFTYIPNAEKLERLAKYGQLPIKDFLTNKRFQDEQTEYVVVGNSIGELSVLTGRDYSCNIISYTSSQAFIISKERMWQAIENSGDPVNGLAPRMWKYLSQNMAKRILLEVPHYKTASNDELNYILNRSVMPELSAYKHIAFSDMLEDAILIEGFVVDSNTKNIYTAPCFIPRTVQTATMPKYCNLRMTTLVEPRIMIIPLTEMDEYEVILRIEQTSDINKHAASRFLLTNNLAVQQKRKRYVHLQSKIKTSFGSKGSQMAFDHD